MNGMRRANGCTFAAHLALHVVNICHIVLNLNCVKCTFLHALATADAGIFASLHGNGALILIDAGDKEPTILRTFIAKFDDTLGASLDASATGDALVIIDLGKPSLLVHLDGSELASVDTVTTAEATIGAISLTRKIGSQNSTFLGAIILQLVGASHAITIASNDSHLGSRGYNLLTQNASYLSHGGSTTDRAKQRANVIGLDKRISHAMASREAAAATVGAWQGSLNLADTGVFIDLELLRHKI